MATDCLPPAPSSFFSSYTCFPYLDWLPFHAQNRFWTLLLLLLFLNIQFAPACPVNNSQFSFLFKGEGSWDLWSWENVKDLNAVISQLLHPLRATAPIMGICLTFLFPFIVQNVLFSSGVFYVKV